MASYYIIGALIDQTPSPAQGTVATHTLTPSPAQGTVAPHTLTPSPAQGTALVPRPLPVKRSHLPCQTGPWPVRREGGREGGKEGERGSGHTHSPGLVRHYTRNRDEKAGKVPHNGAPWRCTGTSSGHSQCRTSHPEESRQVTDHTPTTPTQQHCEAIRSDKPVYPGISPPQSRGRSRAACRGRGACGRSAPSTLARCGT